MSTPHPSLKLVSAPASTPAISMHDFEAWHEENCIISDICLEVPKHSVTCLVGPSGAGKSTLLRSLNRINENAPGFKTRGRIMINGQDHMTQFPDVTALRAKVGMVFQRPCVFPRSIAENVLFGVRGQKLSKSEKMDLVEACLKSAELWNEVKGRLTDSAFALSLGQQQRLCIARCLAVDPDILLLDEPTASIDPVSVRAIEDLILELKSRYTIIVVSHDIRQTKRIADHVAFLCDGRLIDQGPTAQMFSMRAPEKTRLYLGEEYCDC